MVWKQNFFAVQTDLPELWFNIFNGRFDQRQGYLVEQLPYKSLKLNI